MCIRDRDKYDKDPNLLRQVTVEDLRAFGMIPEFIGRLPIIFTLDALSRDMLIKVLKEPKNALLKQYQKLLDVYKRQIPGYGRGGLPCAEQNGKEKRTKKNRG